MSLPRVSPYVYKSPAPAFIKSRQRRPSAAALERSPRLCLTCGFLALNLCLACGFGFVVLTPAGWMEANGFRWAAVVVGPLLGLLMFVSAPCFACSRCSGSAAKRAGGRGTAAANR